MTSIWTGHKVRLRGVEPEDWETLQRFEEHSVDMRSMLMIQPPRSAAGFREWAATQATKPRGALHRKIGFRTEGRLRDHDYYAGRYHDVVMMGMTIDEFAAHHPFACR